MYNLFTFFQIIMANSDWFFFVFPEVTLGAKKNLEAESVTWLLRLTITYYSSCVQQKQRKEKKEEKHEIIKKQNMKSKKSRELPRHHRQKTAKKPTKTKPSDVTGVANNYSSIQQTKQEKQTNKQNTLTTILHPKNYRETAVLIGICVDFLSVYFRKIQPGFL